MREGAQFFLGEHNFQNFCKVDPFKNTQSMTRGIISLAVEPSHGDGERYFYGTLKYNSNDDLFSHFPPQQDVQLAV